jgi:hypothetical protein
VVGGGRKRGWLVPHRRPRGRRGPPSVERGINTAVGACLPPRAWRRRRETLVVRLHVPAPAASTSARAFLLLGISSMCCVLSSSLLAQLGPRELGGVHRVMPRKGCSWWPAGRGRDLELGPTFAKACNVWLLKSPTRWAAGVNDQISNSRIARVCAGPSNVQIFRFRDASNTQIAHPSALG